MKKITVYTILIIILFSSCSKYLDKLADPNLAVPTTMQGMQRLTDNNLLFLNSTPGLGHLGTDDLWYTDSIFQLVGVVAQNAYTWKSAIFQDDQSLSWSAPYEAIYYCNVVLANLSSVTINEPSDFTLHQTVQGTALFLRSFYFFNLEETFGQPYRPATADKDEGILLRVQPDLYQRIGRSTVKTVFQQMIADVRKAIPLLPDSLQLLHRNRPCKAAAHALLARIYLTMQQYDSALVHADSSLLYNGALIDYNDIAATGHLPYSPESNGEVLFQASAVDITGQAIPYALVDTSLYASFEDDDLRKALFFRKAGSAPGVFMKPGYAGTLYLFSGMAVDEVQFIRAECLARLQQKDAALAALNVLLRLRYRTGVFQPRTAVTADDALRLVLTERRKELLFRELRWFDLRRLNQDPRFAVTLRRVTNGVEYLLAPESKRYTYPIPQAEIRLGGIEQNQR